MDAATTDQTSTPAEPRKRRRPALSCVQCRQKKIRCDRNVPCSRCKRSKNVICVYDPEPSHAGSNRAAGRASPTNSTSASSTLSLTTGISHDGTLTSYTWNNSNYGTDLTNLRILDNIGSGRDGLQGPPFPRNAQSASTIQGLVDRVHTLEALLSQSSQTRSSENSNRMPSLREPQLLKESVMSKKGRLFGRSHWMNTAEQFNKLAALRTLAGFRQDSKLRVLLEKCKSLARLIKASDNLVSSPPLGMESYLPSRQAADELVHLYFRTFESVHRILHIPSFYKDYSQYWNRKLESSTNNSFLAKLLLIMSIGSCFHQDLSLRFLAPQWIYSAQLWLGDLSDKAQLNISGLQISCLLLIAKQINARGDDQIWISTGSLLRAAMFIGLHRDPKHFPQTSIFQAEIRRRLWFTVIELNVQYALNCGMVPLISYEDFDCEPPSNINDEEIDEDTKLLPASKSWEVFTQTFLQIALTRSLPTRLSITSMLNKFNLEMDYEHVLKLSNELLAHLRSQSAFSQSFSSTPASNPGSQPTYLETNVLDLLTRRFLLALHIPFAVQSVSNQRYYFSQRVATDSVMTMFSYPEEDSLDGNGDYRRLKEFAGGIYGRELIVHGYITLSLELMTKLAEESGLSFYSKLSRVPLRKVFTDIVGLARHRLEVADTNIQGYIFGSMAMAEIDALETGQPVKDAVLEAAEKAGEDAYEILRVRAAGVPGADPTFDWDLMMQDTGDTNSTPGDFWVFSAWDDVSGMV